MFVLTPQQKWVQVLSAYDALAINALALEARKKSGTCGWRSIDACLSCAVSRRESLIELSSRLLGAQQASHPPLNAQQSLEEHARRNSLPPVLSSWMLIAPSKQVFFVENSLQKYVFTSKHEMSHLSSSSLNCGVRNFSIMILLFMLKAPSLMADRSL